MTEQWSMKQCCDEIMSQRDKPSLNYAINYARSGANMTGHEAKVQALYLLNNIISWRGANHKIVRESLRAISVGG
jgi:hypothetical protein